MNKKDLLSRPSDPERETMGQVLQNLGVEVVRTQKKTVTGVRWVEKGRQRAMKPMLSLTKDYLYFNREAVKMIRTPELRYSIGAGKYDGKRVILIRPDDVKGYLITPKEKTRNAMTTNNALMGFLRGQGLGLGKYDLVAINGGWMGVPRK